MQRQNKQLLIKNQCVSTTSSIREGLQSAILEELKELEEIVKHVYEETILLHKVAAPLFEIQKELQEHGKMI